MIDAEELIRRAAEREAAQKALEQDPQTTGVKQTPSVPHPLAGVTQRYPIGK